MKQLAIDIGNTAIHYGIVDAQFVTNTGHFPTAELLSDGGDAFRREIEPLLAEVEGVAYGTVVPAACAPLEAALQGMRLFHLTHRSCRGLELSYPAPEEIGEDRLANAMAAQAYFSLPAVVIDMGTAVTFDIVTKQGYEGGIIAPGLGLMTRYLHEQTALLPALKAEDLVDYDGIIGKSTVHAMKIGVSVGFTGMIEALSHQLEAELERRGHGRPVLLSTGGSVANLARRWAARSRFLPDLTLLGLGVAYRRQFETSSPD